MITVMSIFVYSSEVTKALKNNMPVVALESTIITHGMPFPENLKTARMVETEVRRTGSTPATISVMNGRIHVGLDDDELETLARARNAAKLSRADMAVCLAQGGTGSTTVAATMIAANRAGIEVFATGGIGGVHRGADSSFDISADLQELAQTHVTVVSAGAKAILDLPKTLEVLETLGVPVIAYGQDDFPAFWSATSDLRAPLRMDDVAQIAASHRIRADLGIPGGQLVANPIPLSDEIPIEKLEPMITQAIEEAGAQGAIGKDLTPYLLKRIHVLTKGQSLKANIALVLNNAYLGGLIALEISRT